jgi:hypothetical protein
MRTAAAASVAVIRWCNMAANLIGSLAMINARLVRRHIANCHENKPPLCLFMWGFKIDAMSCQDRLGTNTQKENWKRKKLDSPARRGSAQASLWHRRVASATDPSFPRDRL